MPDLSSNRKPKRSKSLGIIHIAYEYGIGTVFNREGEEIRKERHVCIWKNIDDNWKIYRDIVQGVQMQ